MKAIIVGASSGIGAQLAKDLAADGYSVGLAARRRDMLESVAGSLPSGALIKVIDLNDVQQAQLDLAALIADMGGVDLFVISAGVGFENPDLDWALEAETIAVNVVGFAGMVNVAVEHLVARGAGHLVAISSIAAIRGHGDAPAYGASKAFVSNYMQAIGHRFAKLGLPLGVTDVQAGFVDTAMAKGEGIFWLAAVPKASQQILRAIRQKKSHVYVTKRWRLVAWLLRLLPEWLYRKM